MTSPDDRITSAANPLVKRVRRLLTDRRFRDREGVFVVEGAQPTGRALEAGWDVDVVLTCSELLADSPAARMVRDLAPTARVADLSREVFLRISDRDGPAGVAAVVHRPAPDTGDVLARPGPVVALFEPANPGNVGSVVRTADAAGATAVIVIGDAVDPYSPAVVKASMGSIFAVPVVRLGDLATLRAAAAAAGRPVVAVSGSATTNLWDLDYPQRPVLLFGSERRGLPVDVPADHAVGIPMTGTAESLNLAAAAAIVLYEVRRRAS